MSIHPTDLYKLIANIPDSLTETVLIDYTPKVSDDEKIQGFMLRYFVRQTNHASGFITEISESDYQSLRLNKFYTTVEVQWRIAGPLDDVLGPRTGNSPTRISTGVITANRLSLAAAEKVLPGMMTRVRNMTQFYQS